jgi:hypothetical protein
VTIVAGFEFQGIPILMGDLLITPLDGRGRNPSSRPARELSQKVVKLSDHFVLGWAGNLKTANSVFSRIRRQIRGQALTLDRVEEILTTCPNAKGDRKLYLLGWVVEESGPVCFSWESDNIHIIKRRENMYGIGSGYTQFEKAYYSLEGYKELDLSNVKHIAEYLPAMYVLAIAGRLMELETLSYRKFKKISDSNTTFGHAYECIYYNGERFKYLNDVMYIFLQKAINPENSSYTISQIILLLPFFRVVSRSRLTAVVSMGNPPAQFSIARPPGETTRSAKSIEKYIIEFEQKLNATSPVAKFYVVTTHYSVVSRKSAPSRCHITFH